MFGFLTSCSQETKQNLGFVKNMPDEYKVIKHEKLKLPQKTKLTKPGHPTDTRRKQHVTKKTSALLFQEKARDQNPLHGAEKEFLKELGVHGNKEVYSQLSHDSEKSALQEKQWQNKVKDTVFFWKKSNKKKAKVINAEEESKNIEMNDG